MTLFGQGTDIHDIIELLEAAIASDRFHEHRGWTARWNLACALRRLPSRADQALDVLLPVLELDAHPLEAFELCLLWALEQNRQDVLAILCLRARHYEAHLAALQDASRETPPWPGGSAITSGGSTAFSGTRTASSRTLGSACSSRSSTN